MLVRWVASLVLTAVLASAALSPSVWVGISYYAASRQAPAAATAGIGALGVYASVLHGAAWSFALGGPAGLVAGAAAGL